MISAPSAIMRRACASARSGAINWPPSENESGVTFRTPITVGYGLDNTARSPGRSIEAADVAVLEGVAIMRSLCAVPAWESRRGRRAGAGLAECPLRVLVADFRLKLAGLCDQLFDRLFRRQNTDEFAPCIHFFHVLRQAAWVTKSKFANRRDAGGAYQADLGFAHAGDAHVVRNIGPLQQLLLANAGLRCKSFAAFHVPGCLKQTVGRSNAQ